MNKEILTLVPTPVENVEEQGCINMIKKDTTK